MTSLRRRRARRACRAPPRQTCAIAAELVADLEEQNRRDPPSSEVLATNRALGRAPEGVGREDARAPARTCEANGLRCRAQSSTLAR
jgi:hypothetical protein